MNDEDKEYITPGQETTAWSDEVDEIDRAYWYILCPCGQVHERTVTKYWDEGSDGFNHKIVETHCFHCDKTGKHYRVERRAPFKILGEIPIPALKTDVDDDDHLKVAFE